MGRKHAVWRHPGIIYITGILLAGWMMSGCLHPAYEQPATQKNTPLFNQLLTDFEQQIQAKDFQRAALTNRKLLELMTHTGNPQNTESTPVRLARTTRILVGQVLRDNNEKTGLLRQIKQKDGQLETKSRSITALNGDIKTLHSIISTLKTEKDLLERQIERMKQIDLK